MKTKILLSAIFGLFDQNGKRLFGKNITQSINKILTITPSDENLLQIEISNEFHLMQKQVNDIKVKNKIIPELNYLLISHSITELSS